MKKQLFFLPIILISFFSLNAQTYATDFTAVDCDGTTHHLFSEIDNGKVVVIAWVMPCATCITDPLNAYTAVQSYSSSHPGQVLFYLADDYANTSCQSLYTWANNYGMGNTVKFSDAAIDMSDYGQPGMPKVVVLGGTEHKVYFNQNSASQGINTAIDQALAESATNTTIINNEFSLATFPNPANEIITLSISNLNSNSVSIEIFNLLGAKVYTSLMANNSSKNNLNVDVSQLKNGVYFLNVSSGLSKKVLKFNVAH